MNKSQPMNSAADLIHCFLGAPMPRDAFMVATCDYVIIGEEFYAASAYLSQDQVLKGSLKAQDVVKAVILALIVLGVLFAALERAFDLDLGWFFDFWGL